MTAVIIKASVASSLAAPSGQVAMPAQIDPELARLVGRIKALEARLTQKDESIAKLKEAASSAYAQGEAAGKEAAAAAFEDREEDRLELLRQGIAQAVGESSVALANSERLAVLVARECLDRMIGDTATRGAFVQDLIRHQYARLDAQSILAVRVSPIDFTELGALQLAHDAPALKLQRDGQLEAGEVQVDLTLGTVFAGIDQQWGSLRTILSDLAGVDS